jgi:hypothetical protein
MVSKPFKSPLPIRKISLTVDQSIPKAFTDFDPTFPWIKYFVSVDGGSSFVPIAPEEASILRGEDSNKIKQFINVNARIATEDRDPREEYIDTTNPVFEVRFRCVMSRPTTIPDANNYTPILRSYRLKIIPDRSENIFGSSDLSSNGNLSTEINS